MALEIAMMHDLNSAPDAKSFIDRVTALPNIQGVSLDSVLAPSVKTEAELRRLYAQDRNNARIADPYVGLVSVFDAPANIRTTRARIVRDEDDLSAKHIFPIDKSNRRKEGEPCMVGSLEEYQKNWSIFTEGSLSQLTDWNNVIAGGGSVLGCLLPLSERNKESKRNIRKFYHSEAYPTSDVDLFIWGLNSEQAEVKINQIYDAVRDSIPWDVTCVRTKHAISIHSQYPYRSIQIVLRLYQSPAEILAGFDVDSACFAYDGSRILANPRSIVAMMRQANTIDITRRSPSYEIRLAKYAARGFEIYVPELRRGDVDPTIFERSINRIIGLARLLVLEKLAKPQARQSYLESRRNIRTRANNTNIYQARNRRKRKYKNDLKDAEEIGGLEFNDYDLVSLHIPYGPGWTSKRIEKLVYQTDLGTNSLFNPRNKGRRLHRHPAFFGTMKECIEDICGYCPEPRNKEEKELRELEDKSFVRGRVSFMEDDPGRQSMTGSFNPIDFGEWSEQAYLGPTERLFSCIAALERDLVKQMITSGNADINRRDHVGRTALHVAVMCKASDICIDLINAGARMTARLVDGRTALHIAAQLDLPAVVERMIQKSAENAAKAKEEKDASEAAKADETDDEKIDDADNQEASSEDDWSSIGKDDMDKKEAETSGDLDENAAIPEDNLEDPDILDVNATDWDLAFTPLAYAIVGGTKRVVQILLNAGSDPKLATKANDHSAPVLHPLTITCLSEDEDKSLEIISELIRAGASSAQANEKLFSVFHTLVCSGRTRIVEKILREDPKASSAINVPALGRESFYVYPLVSAIAKGHYATAALLVGYHAKVQIHAEDVQKAKNMVSTDNTPYYSRNNEIPHVLDYLKDVVLPTEAACSHRTYLLKFLVALNAQISIPIRTAVLFGRNNQTYRLSLLDWVTNQTKVFKEDIAAVCAKEQIQSIDIEELENPISFEDHCRMWAVKTQILIDKTVPKSPEKDTSLERSLCFYEEMEGILKESGAKTYSEIYPDMKQEQSPDVGDNKKSKATDGTHRAQYKLLHEHMWRVESVLPHMLSQYDALFKACWTGDNEKIEELCLPRKGTKSDKVPIQIAVMRQSSWENFPRYDDRHTPLSVSIKARRWDTARLVLAIAIAQWEPPEDKPAKFAIKNINLDEDLAHADSDDESLASDETEDDEPEQNPREIGSFNDLSNRTSAVKSKASPNLLMSTRVTGGISQDGKRVLAGSVFDIAAEDGDLQAFVNVCNLEKLLSTPELPKKLDVHKIMMGDSPEILDEFIRRTGQGIEVEQEEGEEQEQAVDTMAPKQSKIYLGLTVHGKKRKDLAKIGDVHAKTDNSLEEIPLLWTAVRYPAKKIIEYLAGPGPLAAYRYYSSTASDERALAMRKYPLEKKLPALLGITPNFRNETPLTALFVGMNNGKDRLANIKHVLSLFPLQAKAYIHSSLRFVHWNLLMLAVMTGCDNSVFDFLLSSGISAEAIDERGYNILHIICREGTIPILDYFLGKLSEDILSRLLIQTSREGGNTPLMLAVKSKQLGIVDALFQSKLAAVKDSLFIRDRNGSLPVHVAVTAGSAKIVSSILTNSSTDILYNENAVGETPIETATIKWLLHATHEVHNSSYINVQSLNIYNKWKTSTPLNVEKLSSEVEYLKSVQAGLDQDGKLAANPDLKKALDSFIPYLNRKIEKGIETTSEESITKNANAKGDSTDHIQTLKVINPFISASQRARQLVHLTDVHYSVRTSLEQATKPPKEDYDYGRHRRRLDYAKRKFEKEEVLPDEADRDEVAKEQMWKGILRFQLGLRSDDPL